MSTSQPRRTALTAEQLYDVPDDGRRHELLRGMVVSEPLPGIRHGRTVSRLAQLLTNHVGPRRLGIVLTGDAGFVLARDPDTVRGPDVAFVSAERAKSIDPARPYFPGAPDLAIEVVSPSDRPNEVLGKVSDFLAAGCRIVWLVDPALEEVRAFRTPFEPRSLSGEDVLEGEEVLPEFSVRVLDLFED